MGPIKDEPWEKALRVLLQLDSPHKKLDYYLKNLDENDGTYAICRGYVLDVVKHRALLEFWLKKLTSHLPKPYLKNFLYLVIGQLWQKFLNNVLDERKFSLLVNGWVERCKRRFSLPECRFVNAILRRVFRLFEQADQLPLAIRYSTPDFLIQRYQAYYGDEALLSYLRWNEGFSTIYVRSDVNLPGLEKTQWPTFYRWVDNACWPKIIQLVKQGKAYIQDPMTRIPVNLLQVEPGQNVLDLCAAPGGKTVQIAQKLKGCGNVVAVDLPEHMQRLTNNVSVLKNVHLLGKDVMRLSSNDVVSFVGQTLFDRVLIDVPCSNTGVVRRKPDVWTRLRAKDFEILPEQQLQLLSKASEFVKKDGLLMYSTCSIDPEENEGVVKKFLMSHATFSLLETQISLPWRHQHDGGGAFCLKRIN